MDFVSDFVKVSEKLREGDLDPVTEKEFDKLSLNDEERDLERDGESERVSEDVFEIVVELERVSVSVPKDCETEDVNSAVKVGSADFVSEIEGLLLSEFVLVREAEVDLEAVLDSDRD